MQSIKYLNQWMNQNANEKHFLFRAKDLRVLFLDLSDSAFKVLLSRAAKTGLLTRVCRGVYLFKQAMLVDGLLLFHVAALLRGGAFNYISLETVLSEVGVISQIPMNWISVMSSGRSSIIKCGEFGTIEFVHTNQKPAKLAKQLSYDRRYGFWRASVKLAIRDMKATHRSCDLIDWDVVSEFI